MEQRLSELAAHVRVARASDRVYKDECMFSFDSPFSPEGLFTNLSSFESFGAPMLALDRNADPNRSVYLHQRHTRVRKQAKDSADAKATPTKLAIGGEGGFAASTDDLFDVVKEHALVFSLANGDRATVPLTSADVPAKIREAADAVLSHAGNLVEEAVESWQHVLQESRYANDLVQLPDAPKISSSPAMWKCQAPDCDKQENLWLNLSDGFIGCGRKNWDGTGGCGAALQHYKDTGNQFPLAVKLGTITADGGDVFSYAADEDDLVTNKHLAKHLTHFGINVNNMKKTDKSMNELEVALNNTYEFDTITEAGKKLIPVSGPGYVGFKNLGNSCYMNSVLQLLLALPEVRRRYFEAASTIFATCTSSPADDFAVQMAKAATGVLSDRYKVAVAEGKDDEPDPTAVELRPSSFRSLVGKGHAEFSTGQQQDAVEYLQYLLDFMTRSERAATNRIGSLLEGESSDIPSASLFKFAFEDRVQCLQSKKVKYVSRDDSFVQVQIPLELATNAKQVSEYQVLEQKRQRLDESTEAKAADRKTEKVIPVVPFQTCLEKTLAPELIENFLSPATGQKGLAEKTVRFKSFPRYLLVQMRRFFVDEDWTPKKMEVSVEVPETLSLGKFMSTGMQATEEALPEDSTASQADSAAPTADEALVAQLVSMGFSENGCKRAAIATGNSTAEAAMEWIISHMEDPDFNDPPQSTSAAKEESVNMEHVLALSAMGFSEEQAKCALSQTGNSPDRAAEWLFSHMDDLDAAVNEWKGNAAKGSSSGTPTASNRLDNTVGDYSLVGFVSHVGKNTNSGHYVGHIKKDGRWVIFNDDKVALSEDPPLGAGYLYLFRRHDVEA
ncbi:TPA: hypothetical protein N0F65_004476 [Lagenidium giganteum]|uniref:Ubiquitin carboxyl-terminal hydrolase n=1 Tax=Lagenidium giganteum TaxID=4803 RepID=A0AAV2ZGX3_9STRA|nr:TPA: hypothetical protein N0F65_004476 [Lagenidium giganteum]